MTEQKIGLAQMVKLFRAANKSGLEVCDGERGFEDLLKQYLASRSVFEKSGFTTRNLVEALTTGVVATSAMTGVIGADFSDAKIPEMWQWALGVDADGNPTE